jgi:HPt (histidine-containing phosphotransfer) domain-containing protein
MTDHEQQSPAGKIIAVVDEELRDLVPGYMDNRRKDLMEVRSALERGDFETIRSLGHKMKGSGGGYGFDGISEIGQAFENGAKNASVEDVREQVQRLENYLDQVEIVYQS